MTSFNSFEEFYKFAVENYENSSTVEADIEKLNLKDTKPDSSKSEPNPNISSDTEQSSKPNNSSNSTQESPEFYEIFTKVTENFDYTTILLKLDTSYNYKLKNSLLKFNEEISDLEKSNYNIIQKASTSNNYSIDEINQLNLNLITKRENLIEQNFKDILTLHKQFVDEFKCSINNILDPKISQVFYKNLLIRIQTLENEQNYEKLNGSNNFELSPRSSLFSSLTQGGSSLGGLGGGGDAKLFKKQSSTSSFDTLPDAHLDKVDEHFSVNIGHQLKSNHNLRLIRGDITHTYANYSIDLRQEERLRSFSTIYQCDPTCAFLVNETNFQNNFGGYAGKSLYRKIQESALKYPEYHFYHDTSFDMKKQIFYCIAGEGDFLDTASSPVSTSTSNLPNSASTHSLSPHISETLQIQRFSTLKEIDTIFWFKTKRKNILKPLNQNNPILANLKDAIKLATTNNFRQIIIPVLLTDQLDECMTLSWISERSEAVFKYVKGFLSEAAVELKSLDSLKYKPTGLSVHFILPVNLNDLACERVRNKLLEIYRTSASLNF